MSYGECAPTRTILWARLGRKRRGQLIINSKSDELTKSLAQSVTRRGALKKFALGLAGMRAAGGFRFTRHVSLVYFDGAIVSKASVACQKPTRTQS
jgi:hypothetical protein